MDTCVLPSQTDRDHAQGLHPCSPWARPSHHVVRYVQGCTRRPDSLSFTEPQTRPWLPVSQGGTPRASCEPRASELIPPVTASLQPTWRVLCRETSQTEKDKHCVVSLIHRLLKKNRSQAHRNIGLGLPEAPGEAGLPASATPRAFCPSVVKNVWLPGKATRGEDGVWACAAPPSAARLPAQTRGLGPPV